MILNVFIAALPSHRSALLGRVMLLYIYAIVVLLSSRGPVSGVSGDSGVFPPAPFPCKLGQLLRS